MTRHVDEARLNDYVDGLLDADGAAAVEAHLRDCVACRAAAAALRSLVADVRALPREIAPPAHLRAAIRSAAEQPAAAAAASASVVPLRPRREALRSLRYPLAAAAVVLVTLTAVVTRWAVRREGPRPPVAVAPEVRREAGPATSPVPTVQPPAPRAAPPPVKAPAQAASLASFRRDESRYADQIRQLQDELRSRRDQLSPATLQILEHNLAVIDRALAESRSALEKDPGNRTLAPLILSVYEQKLQLLRRAREYTS